jgi:hypothetical protein
MQGESESEGDSEQETCIYIYRERARILDLMGKPKRFLKAWAILSLRRYETISANLGISSLARPSLSWVSL